MYLVHYVLQSKEDEFKHIHGSTIVSGGFSINNFSDAIALKEESRISKFNITLVGWNKI